MDVWGRDGTIQFIGWLPKSDAYGVHEGLDLKMVLFDVMVQSL